MHTMLTLGGWFIGVTLILFGHTWIAIPFIVVAIIALGGRNDRDRRY